MRGGCGGLSAKPRFSSRDNTMSCVPTKIRSVSGRIFHSWVRRGDRDEAIPLMRTTADHQFRDGGLLGWGIVATGALVETLLDRGAESDVVEAEAAIERLAEAAIERFLAAPADKGLVIRDIWLLRLRALLARTHGDNTGYRNYRDRYRDMAKTLGFEAHIAWAEAMR